MPWITVTYQIPAEKLETLNEFVNNLLSQENSAKNHSNLSPGENTPHNTNFSSKPFSYQEYENFKQELQRMSQPRTDAHSSNRSSNNSKQSKRLRPKVKIPPRIIAG
jgi:hypothetical protein